MGPVDNLNLRVTKGKARLSLQLTRIQTYVIKTLSELFHRTNHSNTTKLFLSNRNLNIVYKKA